MNVLFFPTEKRKYEQSLFCDTNEIVFDKKKNHVFDEKRSASFHKVPKLSDEIY